MYQGLISDTIGGVGRGFEASQASVEISWAFQLLLARLDQGTCPKNRLPGQTRRIGWIKFTEISSALVKATL